MSPRSWIAAALLLSGAGCVTTDVVLLDPEASYGKVPIGRVQIFDTEQDVGVPFEGIAFIYASGAADFHVAESLLNAIVEKAAEIGADAIILEANIEPHPSERLDGQMGRVSERRARVLAIRFTG